jgi:hypothetical protein
VKGFPIVAEMPQHDTLDRHRRGGDRPLAGQAGAEAEGEAARGAERIGPAPPKPSRRERCPEDGAMSLLVGLEGAQLVAHRLPTEERAEPLAAIDADRSMLAGMDDLEDPVPQFLSGVQAGGDFGHSLCSRRRRRVSIRV